MALLRPAAGGVRHALDLNAVPQPHATGIVEVNENLSGDPARRASRKVRPQRKAIGLRHLAAPLTGQQLARAFIGVTISSVNRYPLQLPGPPTIEGVRHVFTSSISASLEFSSFLRRARFPRRNRLHTVFRDTEMAVAISSTV